MRLRLRLCLLAATFVLLAALAPGVTAIAIGGPSGGFIIPGGSTASFTNAQFSACNNLSWGYQLDGGANVVLFTKPYSCVDPGPLQYAGPDVTIGPFATPMVLRVFLTDNTCNATYYSDGLPVDHVIVSGSNPYSLRFADAGFSCERTTTFNDFASFNFRVDLAISGFSFAPGGGSFVISGQNAVIGNSVTFWGAQWAKDNSLIGGSAPDSFKGFAENPTTPSCGAAWSADPGNSTPPPDGPLPAFMAVIVTSSADKSGSTISGNTVQIVIVQTDPGYAPNPGHAGTGTVVAVAVVC
jgi:hypothetical protein